MSFDRGRDRAEILELLHSPLAAVAVPVSLAIVSGFMAGLFVGVIRQSWRDFFIMFVAAAAAVWFVLVIRWAGLTGDLAKVIRPVEEIRQPDPDPVPVIVEVIEQEGGYIRAVRAEFGLSRDQLQQVSRRLAAGAAFTEGSLSGPGAPLTRSEFRQLRDTFITRNLARWRSPHAHNQGAELTGPGRAAVRFLAETTTPQERR